MSTVVSQVEMLSPAGSAGRRRYRDHAVPVDSPACRLRSPATPLYLFYSNWRPELASFLPELHELQRSNPQYRLIATMTDPDASAQPWPGQTGVIDAELLKQHLPDLTSPVYYVAGPPPMALAMLDLLQDLGVDDDAIKSAEFYGY